MASFEYHVKDKTGKDIKGTQDAEDSADLVKKLKAQGHLIIRIGEIKKKRVFFSSSKTSFQKKIRGKAGRVKLDDLVIFARQMATLVSAGIPLVQSLDILASQVDKEKFRVMLKQMHNEILSGKSLSEAMIPHQSVFSPLFVHMVRAGESSGKLEEILDRVAHYFEKSAELQKKVRAALMYPMIVSILAFLITFAMLTFIIPKFAVIFRDLNAKLPVPTQILINFSEFLAAKWYWALLALGGCFFAFTRIVKTPAGRLYWDSFLLRMPVFGPIILKVAVSKFARTLATLVKSGVAIIAALEIVSKTSGNARLEVMILELMVAVKRGESLAGPLERGGVFPSMVVRMIAIGEETGELEEMLTKIADFYDTQVDAAVAGLTSLIEPLIIAFLGVVIGGIVVALFLPILTLTQVIK